MTVKHASFVYFGRRQVEVFTRTVSRSSVKCFTVSFVILPYWECCSHLLFSSCPKEKIMMLKNLDSVLKKSTDS